MINVNEEKRVIAKYMGFKIDSNDIITFDPENHGSSNVEGLNSNGFLEYDVNWQWIMPVVQKLKDDHSAPALTRTFQDDMKNALFSTNIMQVFDLCFNEIRFINSYHNFTKHHKEDQNEF